MPKARQHLVSKYHTQYGLPLTAADREISVDLFAGGGGASTGIEMGSASTSHVRDRGRVSGKGAAMSEIKERPFCSTARWSNLEVRQPVERRPVLDAT